MLRQAFERHGAATYAMSDGRVRIHGPDDSRCAKRVSRTHFINIEQDQQTVTFRRALDGFIVAFGARARATRGNVGDFTHELTLKEILRRWGDGDTFALEVIEWLVSNRFWTSPARARARTRQATVVDDQADDEFFATDPALELAPLLKRIGYGNPGCLARRTAWYLGMEEGAGGSELSFVENLRARLTCTDPIMGLPELCELIRVSRNPSPTPVWRHIARIERRLARHEDWDHCRAADVWIEEELGSRDGRTFIAEFLPLPSPTASVWPAIYRRLYPTRTAYETAIAPLRIARYAALFEQHQPAYVICYGKAHWDRFGDLATGWTKVDEIEWDVSVARRGGTVLCRVPFLGNGQVAIRHIGQFADWLRDVLTRG